MKYNANINIKTQMHYFNIIKFKKHTWPNDDPLGIIVTL